MAITPKLEIRQSQSLLMTPQLRQAINLLQMSNLELGELIEGELASNPLLEKESETAYDETPLPQTIDDYAAAGLPENEEYAPDIDYDNQFDDSGSDREGYDAPDNDYSWSDYNESKNKSDGEDFNYFEKRLKDEKSLYLLISEQISLNFTAKIDQAIAFRLAEQLDPAGYFRGDIEHLAATLKIGKEKIKSVLSVMKSFEPSGIFAENLAECLEIQLKDKNRYDPQIAALLQNLPLLAEKKFKELKKLCRAEDEDLLSMISDLKSLNPKPAADYTHDLTTYVIPDVFVRRDKSGNYHVELNSMSLPRLLINRRYCSEIINTDAGKATKRFLKEKLGSANFLVKALHQRAVTILKVCEEIISAQRDFFEQGIEYLKPMALRDVAEKIEMHESTVSRVTANKYMHTPRGIFELKYFFSQAAATFSGDEQTSTLSIKHKIKKMIDEEKPDNILSDDKLVELLAGQGIKIARRTVTKYREAMGIATSGQRKREKRALL